MTRPQPEERLAERTMGKAAWTPPALGIVEGALVATAREVFERLERSEALLGELATREIRRRHAEVDAMLTREPLTLAILGEQVQARSLLIARLLGAPLVDPARSEHEGARISFRHGPAIEYQAKLRGGEVEELARVVPDETAQLESARRGFACALATARDAVSTLTKRIVARQREVDARAFDLAAAHSRREANAADAREAEGALAELGDRSVEAEDRVAEARRALPRYARARPRWWDLPAWIARGLFGATHRSAIESLAQAERDALAIEERRRELEQRVETALRERGPLDEEVGRLSNALGASERWLDKMDVELRCRVAEVAELRADVARLDDRIARHRDERRGRFEEAVRALTDARARGGEVVELIVDVPSLPPRLVLMEVASGGNLLDVKRRWQELVSQADACILGEPGELPRELRLVFGSPLAIPDDPTELPASIEGARCLRVARLAAEAIRAGTDALDAARAVLAQGVQRWIDELEVERAAQVDALESRFARAGVAAHERVCLAIMQARDVIERELARLADAWSARVAGTRSLDELRSVVETATADPLSSARDEARRLFASTIGGGVRDLAPVVLGEELAWSGAREPILVDPLPSWDVAGSIAPSVSWFTARLRPLDAVRSQCVGAMRDRLAALGKRAVAELLEVEPRADELLRSHLRSLVSERIARVRRSVDESIAEARRRLDEESNRDEFALREELRRAAERLATGEDALARCARAATSRE